MADFRITFCERETEFYRDAEGYSCGGEQTGIFDISIVEDIPIHIATVYPMSDDQCDASDVVYNSGRFAKLIAASPDLYAALKKAVDDYGKEGGPWNVPDEPGTWIAMAKEALAKAEAGS